MDVWLLFRGHTCDNKILHLWKNMCSLKEILRFLKVSHFKFGCAVNNLSQGEIKAKIFFSCFTVVFAGRLES